MTSLSRAVAVLLLLLVAGRAAAEPVPPKLELVPAVRRGHPVMWKTGAIITVASVGVGLLGGALVAVGYMRGLNDITNTSYAMVWTGVGFCAFAGGGIAVAGPAVWLSGVGRPPDPN